MEMRRLLLYGFLLTMTLQTAFSQENAGKAAYTIKDGRMYIRINRHIDKPSLEKFIGKYDLGDLNLGTALSTGRLRDLLDKGWRIDIDDRLRLVISKQIAGLGQLDDPEKRMALTEDHPNSYDLFPPRNDDLVYGFNSFYGKSPFEVHDSLVRFYLKGHILATEVFLAGSFSNWQHHSIRMTYADSGWIAYVKLGPGKYWYKFIINGNWTPDHDNSLNESDFRGNVNSVYYKPNVVFTLAGHQEDALVYLTGNFNGWNPSELRMTKGPAGWTIPLYLAEGTYTYKFVVNGKWIEDPANKEHAPDGHKGFNSIYRLGSPHLFTLKGYPNAKSVFLAGTFNGWRTNEWPMQKTPDGWQLPYTLGPGNYQYRFLVDGKWIDDPVNPLFVYNRNHHVANAFLIIQPNYTFRLDGFPDAKEIFLAGDFNDWTPNALKMKHVGNSWAFNVHLSTGKHLYKFVVDGKWIKDPGNPLWENNEYGTDNSILWMEEK